MPTTLLLICGAFLDACAAVCWLQSRKTDDPPRLRTLSTRARIIAALLVFLAFAAPIVGAALAFRGADAPGVSDPARALADGISSSMNAGVIGFVLAIPGIVIAVVLARRAHDAREATGSRARNTPG